MAGCIEAEYFLSHQLYQIFEEHLGNDEVFFSCLGSAALFPSCAITFENKESRYQFQR